MGSDEPAATGSSYGRRSFIYHLPFETVFQMGFDAKGFLFRTNAAAESEMIRLGQQQARILIVNNGYFHHINATEATLYEHDSQIF